MVCLQCIDVSRIPGETKAKVLGYQPSSLVALNVRTKVRTYLRSNGKSNGFGG
jgi:hypothetical protein